MPQKIQFPLEIAACSDIIFSYLAASNADCDYYDLPFQFRIRFLLPALSSALKFWSSHDPPFRRTLVDLHPFQHIEPLSSFFSRRVNHATLIWWGHVTAEATIAGEDDDGIYMLTFNTDEPVRTWQQRWLP